MKMTYLLKFILGSPAWSQLCHKKIDELQWQNKVLENTTCHFTMKNHNCDSKVIARVGGISKGYCATAQGGCWPCNSYSRQYYLSEVGRVRWRDAMFYSNGWKEAPRRASRKAQEKPRETRKAAKSWIQVCSQQKHWFCTCFYTFKMYSGAPKNKHNPITRESRPDPDYPVTVKK